MTLSNYSLNNRGAVYNPKMVRRILTGILLALSSILLAFSLIGIAALWIYRQPLKQELDARLVLIDGELSQTQATLQATQAELKRALHIVDSAEQALQELVDPSGNSENVFESLQNTLDDRIIPDLKTTRERIETARTTLENLRSTLGRVTGLLPFIDLSAPNKIVADLILSAASLDADIAEMEVVARQTSTFVGDTSSLLGGDLGETRKSLQGFLTATQAYDQKVTDWRSQIAELKARAPLWIDRATIGLTVFLAWFALSQFGLILHGISIRNGDNPLWVLRGG